MVADKIEKFPDQIWGNHDLERGKLYGVTLGDLRVWLGEFDKEIRVAYQHSTSFPDDYQVPEEIEWSRWSHMHEDVKLNFKPVYPNRSVLVRPESKFWLLKSAKTRIFIDLPLWIRISLKEKSDVRLIDLPTKILSNTWFGDFFEGELCYWLSTHARRDAAEAESAPFMIRCPIVLVNKSEEDLLVEKICMRVNRMTMFIDNGQLWSDEVLIQYKGGREGSQIRQNATPPEEVPRAKLIRSAENATKKSFAAKTFATLKDIPGFGIIMD